MTATRPTWWFEIQDIVYFFGHHPNPTGIQRLALEVFAALRADPELNPQIKFCRINPITRDFEPVDLDEASRHRVEGELPMAVRMTRSEMFTRFRHGSWLIWTVLRDLMPGPLRAMARAALKAIYSLLRRLYHAAASRPPKAQAPVSQDATDRVMEKYSHRPLMPLKSGPPDFRKGDVLLTFGAFWVVDGYGRAVAQAKEQHGLKYVLLVYDLIPVSCPEWMLPGLTQDFMRELHDVLLVADLALTISRNTQQELLEYSARRGLPTPPSAVFTLGAGYKPPRNLLLKPEEQSILSAGPFILFVSTIEVRKNHTLLLRVWKRLLQKFPITAVPRLLLVGRPGWLSSDFIQQLEFSKNMQGKILLLNNVNDAFLAQLYKSCLFTVYPSLYEGWGLPVGESLMHGAFCIASSRTSIPEVGGDLVDYFDPENVSDAYAKIEHAILNPEYVAARRARIQAEYRPPSWDDSAADLVRHIQRLTSQTVAPDSAAVE